MNFFQRRFSGLARAGIVCVVAWTGSTVPAEGDPLRWAADAEGGAPYIFYDPQDPDSVRAAVEVSDEGDRLKAEKGRPPGGMLLGLAQATHADETKRAQKLARLPEYQWQRKLKELFDPNRVGSGNYFWGAAPEDAHSRPPEGGER